MPRGNKKLLKSLAASSQDEAGLAGSLTLRIMHAKASGLACTHISIVMLIQFVLLLSYCSVHQHVAH